MHLRKGSSERGSSRREVGITERKTEIQRERETEIYRVAGGI